MQKLLGNLRYVLRQFRLSPVFTVAAMLTLALGIGGTTAIFTLIHAVMLRSLPVADPAALYRIGEGDDCCIEGGPQDRWGMFSYPLSERLKVETPEFEQVTAFQAGMGRLSVRRERVESSPRPLRSEYVDGNYFSTLGVSAFGGRLIAPNDDKSASAPVAVLSHHTWQTTYGADTSVLGSTFVIEGHPFTVIGVAAPGFFGETLRSDPPDIWIPLQQEPVITAEGSLLHQSVSAWLRMIGRVRSGVSTAGMSPRLTGVLRQWMEHDSGYPANWLAEINRVLPKQVLNVVPAGAGVAVMKEEYGKSLQILFGVCGLVLLIACANVANLLLALAFQNAHFLPISTAPSPLVLGFAFILALVTGVIFGAAPAWFATRTDPADALRGSGRSTSDRSSFARKALLIVQATFSVVLVAGATMLARSLNKLEHQDFGYQVQGRAVVTMNDPPASYSRAKLASLYRRMEERINRLPGVQGSGLAGYNPLTDNWGEMIIVAGHPLPKMEEESGASWDRVSTDYLKNFGVSVLHGRGFSAADNENSEPVAVVNEAFVKRFFKNNEEPLDQHFGIDLPENAGTFRIIGIVRDAKFAGYALSRPARPMFYVPLDQTVNYKHELLAKIELRTHFINGIMLLTNAAPGSLEPLLTRALAEVDPNLTITSVRTMQQQVYFSFSEERAVASLAGLFGIVALLLAAVGLYGVTAYTVAQRTQEIGIRMALGADRVNVVRMVLAGASRRVLAGLVLGVPLAIGAGRLISGKLYGVSSWDPTALGIAAVALAISAFFAAVIPARRAASISPMKALRTE
jgi:hypothetical protein